MGAKSTKSTSQPVLKLSIAQKMIQREDFLSTELVPAGRKRVDRFDSNGDLSCSYSLTELPRAELIEGLQDPRVQNGGRRMNQGRKKTVAVEVKRTKGRIGLKRLASGKENQYGNNTDSCANPSLILPETGPYTMRPSTSRYPHLSDLCISPRSDGLSSRRNYQQRLMDSAVEELFITDLPKQTKNKAVTVTKSLLRKKPVETKSELFINLSPQSETKSGLMPILHEAVNLQEEMRQSQRKGTSRPIKNLLANKEKQDLSQQYANLFNPGAVQKSKDKVMYVSRSTRKRPISPSQLLKPSSNTRPEGFLTAEPKAKLKWMWMGTHGTVLDGQTRPGSAYQLYK